MWLLCLCGIHCIFCFCFFKHIVLNKRCSKIWNQQCLQGTLGNGGYMIWLLDVCSMLLGLACSADSSRNCACMCIYTQVCMHTCFTCALIHLTFDFRNRVRRILSLPFHISMSLPQNPGSQKSPFFNCSIPIIHLK